jgi:hypothetical protein
MVCAREDWSRLKSYRLDKRRGDRDISRVRGAYSEEELEPDEEEFRPIAPLLYYLSRVIAPFDIAARGLKRVGNFVCEKIFKNLSKRFYID